MQGRNVRYIVHKRDLPLSPISISTAAALVMQPGPPRFRLPHAALILFHLHPGPAGGVVRAPNSRHHQRQQAPVRYHQT